MQIIPPREKCIQVTTCNGTVLECTFPQNEAEQSIREIHAIVGCAINANRKRNFVPCVTMVRKM